MIPVHHEVALSEWRLGGEREGGWRRRWEFREREGMWKSLERRTGEEDSGVQAVTVRSAAPCFPVATFVRRAETERRI